MRDRIFKWIGTLQGKIFFTCFVIAISVMILSVQALYMKAVKAIEENACGYIYESMKYADNNLDIMIEDAKKISLVMATNEKTILSTVEDLPEEAGYEWYLKRGEINDFLSSLVAYKNYIRMAAIVGMDGRCFQSGGEMILKKTTSEEWFCEVNDKASLQIFYNTPEAERIFLCRPIKYNRKITGIAIVELDFGIISQVYNIAPLKQAEIVTVDTNNNVVFSNSEIESAQNINKTVLAQPISEYRPEQKYYTINGSKKLMVRYQSDVNQLTTIGLISYDDLITDALQFRENMFWIVSLSVAIVFIASWFLSRVICRNLQKLQQDMYEVEQGSLKIRAKIAGKDEISDMARGFNSMMDQIEQLLQQVCEKEKQKREAERKVLESQIQPHFIYNTLNSIKYVAHMKAENEIEEVSTALIELIRSVVGKKADEFIPLIEEYRYIEQYMIIQRFKYSKKFVVDWDVEKDLWDFLIPKLLLQPIVENALIHGLSYQDNGRINIKVYRMEEKVIFNITDDGEGMTEATIRQLLSSKQENKNGFRGIGLHNIIDRIHLLYGEEYGIKITSLKGVFTSVKLTLPYGKKE